MGRNSAPTRTPQHAALLPTLNLTSPPTNHLEVTWDEPTETGGSNITGYNISCAAGDNAPFEHMVSVPAGVPVRRVILTDLLGEVRYRCRVDVSTDAGDVLQGPASAPFLVPEGRPAAPGKPKVTDQSTSSMVLNWTAPATTGGHPITGYQLWRKAEHPVGVWEKSVENTGNDETSFVFSGLALGTLYTFRVAALNGPFGAGPFSEKADGRYTSPTVPSQPDAPGLKDPGIEWLLVEWAPPLYDGDSPVLGYTVDLQPPGGLFQPVNVSLDASDLVLNVTDLSKSSFYGIRVSAKNSIGFGEPSPPLLAWTYDADASLVNSTEQQCQSECLARGWCNSELSQNGQACRCMKGTGCTSTEASGSGCEKEGTCEKCVILYITGIALLGALVLLCCCFCFGLAAKRRRRLSEQEPMVMFKESQVVPQSPVASASKVEPISVMPPSKDDLVVESFEEDPA